MQLFQWGSKFFTDLKSIDEEHGHLVNIINKLGEYLSGDSIEKKTIDEYVREIIAYAHFHFESEQKLMLQFNVDPRHYKKHQDVHKRCIKDVRFIYSSLDVKNKNQSNIFLKYLVLCVSHHILGIDQDMATQIKNIQSGMTPEQAYHHVGREAFNISDPLIDVLYDLFIHVEEQNQELKELNQSLEEKVAIRTKELSDTNAHLEKLSLTDPLTNLSNRRHAMQCLPVFWEEAQQKDQPLFCFMMDLDHFKEINDDYGHDTGDLVLTELAEIISEHIHNDDLFCRLGGDEFILICPNTDKTGAERVANIILKQVNMLKVENHLESWKCSISIGGASRTREMSNYQDLIKAADEALYAAKAAGRNCVRFNK